MVLIVDCHSICHQCKHALKKVKLSHEEKDTGIIFGFLRQLLVISKKYKPDNWVFTWDSKKSYRKKLYPDYKRKLYSTQTQEEKEFDKSAMIQFAELRTNVIPKLGFKNSFIQTGYEADDLIASAVKNKGKFIIISPDHDLHQLLSYNVVQYNQISKKEIDYDTFRGTWMIEPKQWSEVKAIAGCTSDNILGVQGIGEVTAAKYIRGELNYKTKKFNDILEHEKRIKENRKLVKLPMEGTMDIEIKENKLLIKTFIDVFDKEYKFSSFLHAVTMDQWIEMFKLT